MQFFDIRIIGALLYKYIFNTYIYAYVFLSINLFSCYIKYITNFADENQEFFIKLKDLVEETYKINNNTPVALIAHSMGGPMSLYFLHQQSQEWKDKYIRTIVTLSGAWGGSLKSIKVYAVGK